jgi:transcriptional regulator with XRE-family HTH domain
MQIFQKVLTKDEINYRFIESVNAVIGRESISKTSLAESLNVKPAKFSEILNGRMRAGADMIAILCDYYGVSPDYILMSRGGIFRGNKLEPIIINEGDAQRSVSFDPSKGTPYYDVDFMGGFAEIINSQTTVPACNIIVPGFEKATVWCNVTGHSMEPKINHGDIIALRECTVQDIQYGEIYAVVLDTLRTIKILRRGTTPDVLRYVPINPDFDDQEFSISRILHVFEVLGSIARFF